MTKEELEHILLLDEIKQSFKDPEIVEAYTLMFKEERKWRSLLFGHIYQSLS